jgi:hypothetical protein
MLLKAVKIAFLRMECAGNLFVEIAQLPVLKSHITGT